MSICSTSVNSTPRPCARRPPQRPNRHSRQRTSCSARLLRNRALHFLIHTPSTPTTHRPVDQNSRNLRQHHPARDNTPRQRYPTDLSHPRQWPCAPKPPSTSNNTPRPAVSHPTVPKPRDRNLPLERLQPVDVAFDGAGTVGQGQALADSVEITAEVASEGRPRGWGSCSASAIQSSRRSPWRPAVITANFLAWPVSRSSSGSRSRRRCSLSASSPTSPTPTANQPRSRPRSGISRPRSGACPRAHTNVVSPWPHIVRPRRHRQAVSGYRPGPARHGRVRSAPGRIRTAAPRSRCIRCRRRRRR